MLSDLDPPTRILEGVSKMTLCIVESCRAALMEAGEAPSSLIGADKNLSSDEELDFDESRPRFQEPIEDIELISEVLPDSRRVCTWPDVVFAAASCDTDKNCELMDIESFACFAHTRLGGLAPTEKLEPSRSSV